MIYRQALAAVARTLRHRAANCDVKQRSGPDEWRHEAVGAKRAYESMADELEYLANPRTPGREVLKKLREWGSK